MKERDIAVDIVKFFAVFLIINSHADACYPKFGILATGGAIGDSLFMFVSGFTLYLGKQIRFDNYYKRRINRIYRSGFIFFHTFGMYKAFFECDNDLLCNTVVYTTIYIQ